MSDEPKTSDSIPDLAGALVRKLVPREAIMLGAFALVLVGAGIWGTVALAGTLDERVDAGMAAERVDREREVRSREDLERRFVQHQADEAASRARLEAKMDESQADTRALYKAVMTGRPQERLERPADGGGP